MKRFVFLILACMFVCLPAIADTSPESKPIAFMAEKTFQFDPVIEGDAIHHEFILKNNGTAPLKILKIESG